MSLEVGGRINVWLVEQRGRAYSFFDAKLKKGRRRLVWLVCFFLVVGEGRKMTMFNRVAV